MEMFLSIFEETITKQSKFETLLLIFRIKYSDFAFNSWTKLIVSFFQPNFFTKINFDLALNVLNLLIKFFESKFLNGHSLTDKESKLLRNFFSKLSSFAFDHFLKLSILLLGIKLSNSFHILSLIFTKFIFKIACKWYNLR